MFTDYCSALAYGNEAEVGEGIRASGVSREEIWLTTKLDNPWHKRVQEGIDSSLKSLGVDYVDLYLMASSLFAVRICLLTNCSTGRHQLIQVICQSIILTGTSSTHGKVVASTDFRAVADSCRREMQKLPATGKVRNIGVSNFGIRNLTKLLNNPSCKLVPAVNQIELHPNNPSPKLVEFDASKNIHSTAYSCLGSTDSPLYKDQTVMELAAKKGKTIQQCLLMWNLQKGRSVLPKSVSKDRIEKNFQLDGWELTRGNQSAG